MGFAALEFFEARFEIVSWAGSLCLKHLMAKLYSYYLVSRPGTEVELVFDRKGHYITVKVLRGGNVRVSDELVDVSKSKTNNVAADYLKTPNCIKVGDAPRYDHESSAQNVKVENEPHRFTDESKSHNRSVAVDNCGHDFMSVRGTDFCEKSHSAKKLSKVADAGLNSCDFRFSSIEDSDTVHDRKSGKVDSDPPPTGMTTMAVSHLNRNKKSDSLNRSEDVDLVYHGKTIQSDWGKTTKAAETLLLEKPSLPIDNASATTALNNVRRSRWGPINVLGGPDTRQSPRAKGDHRHEENASGLSKDDMLKSSNSDTALDSKSEQVLEISKLSDYELEADSNASTLVNDKSHLRGNSNMAESHQCIPEDSSERIDQKTSIDDAQHELLPSDRDEKVEVRSAYYNN
jgi:hypothetical protein